MRSPIRPRPPDRAQLITATRPACQSPGAERDPVTAGLRVGHGKSFKEDAVPHGITHTDHLFSVRETPGHRLGAVLEHHPASIAEALMLAGLDWRVEQRPLCLAGAPVEPLEGHLANLRSDT